MELSKFERAVKTIKKNQLAYACPICGTRMKITKSGRLICKKEHTFDVSKKGYINFINETKKTNYDKELFESRKKILNAGFYDPVLSFINNVIFEYMKKYNLDNINILDVGCGEGYYSYCLSKNQRYNIFAFDISKEAIGLATDYSVDVNWCIADLSNLPFKERSMDIIIDILSPANYKEFKRVLKNQGLLIKVIPGDNYLKEIRDLASSQLKNKTYSNRETADYSAQNIKIEGRDILSYKMPITQTQLLDFIKMTPMTSSVNLDQLEKKDIHNVTVSMEIFSGKL